MKIGYPGINYGLGCTSAHTLRLANLSDERVIEVARMNIACLWHMLRWNVANNLLFFRISSNIIPLASHSAMTTNWQAAFADELAQMGAYIREHNMRISMHPGQFVVLNSQNEQTYRNSVAELAYHAEFLDMMGLDATHKIQFHLGGVFGEPEKSFALFAQRHTDLPEAIRSRLVVENDERVASVQDLIHINTLTSIPILFDTLHHTVKNNGESMIKGLDAAMQTWKPEDGIPLIDYSTQDPYKKTGAHAVTLDVEHFRRFIKALKGRDIDIMLEIKNKEASALQAQLVVDSLEVHKPAAA